PVGSLLLLWPTYWAMWVAAEGVPSIANMVIFTLGVLLMRAAGCVINDIADRKVDGHVKRTAQRPLATGAIRTKAAVIGFLVLCILAFLLVLNTNTLTIQLSVGGVILAFIYPFMKRHTHLPQVFLGAAFSWSIPMAFAAESNSLPAAVWLLYAANLCWTVAYDTLYAMVDRDDDLVIGVKSTAILFGAYDIFMIIVLQALAIIALLLLAIQIDLGIVFYLALLLGAVFLMVLNVSAKDRSRERCFRAFRLNHWFGAIVWLGFILNYALV
ncbi:MAG: 4-hydroxybenzoate octaprenyltransferase, partial [Oleibacter sp.]|nr:4-hydroxybenzoate octaprenyltransferase [Thalassolituus sp.]